VLYHRDFAVNNRVHLLAWKNSGLPLKLENQPRG